MKKKAPFGGNGIYRMPEQPALEAPVIFHALAAMLSALYMENL